uniref:DNA-directed RNA polymerase II subunit 1-like n=1 Tax=Rhizophora mucronata TaxID=61149 RepID=A0A2P2JV45_RHIMU
MALSRHQGPGIQESMSTWSSYESIGVIMMQPFMLEKKGLMFFIYLFMLMILWSLELILKVYFNLKRI